LKKYAAFAYGNIETLAKIVSTIQDSPNTVNVNTFLSREKCSECLLSSFMYICQTISKTLDSFVNCTCRKLSHIFFHVT